MLEKTKYLISVTERGKILNDGIPEIAFVGRSNVGKSSLINNLTNQKKLARTSGTPGLTRMINYFDCDEQLRLVDLPGYGYARASKEKKEKWDELIGHYLTTSKSLKLVFVLIDVRHAPSKLDVLMVEYLEHYGIPFKIIATKADKLSKSQLNKQLALLRKEYKAEILPHSSSNGFGRCEILDIIGLLG